MHESTFPDGRYAASAFTRFSMRSRNFLLCARKKTSLIATMRKTYYRKYPTCSAIYRSQLSKTVQNLRRFAKTTTASILYSEIQSENHKISPLLFYAIKFKVKQRNTHDWDCLDCYTRPEVIGNVMDRVQGAVLLSPDHAWQTTAQSRLKLVRALIWTKGIAYVQLERLLRHLLRFPHWNAEVIIMRYQDLKLVLEKCEIIKGER